MTQSKELVTASADGRALRLVQLSETEIHSQIGQNSIIWKGPLTIEAYARREEVLASQRLTENAGITYWGLVEDDQGQNPRDRTVLAGCESIKKRALVVRAGSNEVKVEDTMSEGIASVFCPPHFRSRGFSRQMMELLANALPSQSQEEACLFSILYSDIGKVSGVRCPLL